MKSTRAPRRAKDSTQAFPMPLDPPVTMTSGAESGSSPSKPCVEAGKPWRLKWLVWRARLGFDFFLCFARGGAGAAAAAAGGGGEEGEAPRAVAGAAAAAKAAAVAAAAAAAALGFRFMVGSASSSPRGRQGSERQEKRSASTGNLGMFGKGWQDSMDGRWGRPWR